MKAVKHALTGEEKARYLHQLDSALAILANGLLHETEDIQSPELKLLAEEREWDWSRLVPHSKTYESLSNFVNQVRREYQWLDWVVDPTNHEKNKGYFTEINIDAATGLPWQHDFVQLDILKKRSTEKLKVSKEYDDFSGGLIRLLLEDFVEIDQVPPAAGELHNEAMKRSFLEQLQESDLIPWEAMKHQYHVRKVRSLGAEELWNLSFIRYSQASGMFESYDLDVWQDIMEPVIVESEEGVAISGALKSTLQFGRKTAAWFMLQRIDEKFESLHPVHISRSIIGPFENKYLTRRDEKEHLEITSGVIDQDPNSGIFHFRRQYAYAPTHQEKDGRLRQIIHQDDWNDHYLVCPARFASQVSRAVLGTGVKVFES